MSLLKNIRVLDLTRFVAGPHCTSILSDLGADVIKIEKCDRGDDLRIIGPSLEGVSLWSAVLNRGKKSLSLNLKDEKGLDIFRKLLKNSDVLVENFRPGVMEKLKLSWNNINKINKRIIMARVSGYGYQLKNSSRQAFDATVQAETGFMNISGTTPNKPTMIGTVLLDYTTGLNLTIGILAALYNRKVTGKGQLIEASLVSSALSMTMAAVPNYFLNKEDFNKKGNLDRYSAPSNTYKAKNGFIHIMAGSNDRFYGLAMAMNKKNLIESTLYKSAEKRLENIKSIDKIVEQWTKNYTVSELGKKLTKFSVPWGKVRKFSDFLKTKEAKQYLKQASIKDKNITVPNCSVKIAGKKKLFKKNVPQLGQHNLKILKELGFNDKQINLLKKEKII